MKYIKTFERVKTNKPINVGDEVIWIGKDRKNYGKFYTSAESNP